jgi:hypothetical protein
VCRLHTYRDTTHLDWMHRCLSSPCLYTYNTYNHRDTSAQVNVEFTRRTAYINYMNCLCECMHHSVSLHTVWTCCKSYESITIVGTIYYEVYLKQTHDQSMSASTNCIYTLLIIQCITVRCYLCEALSTHIQQYIYNIIARRQHKDYRACSRFTPTSVKH